jgi:SAM-dependent methyltransferase
MYAKRAMSGTPTIIRSDGDARLDHPLQEWRTPRRTMFDYLALSHLAQVLQRKIEEHLAERRDLMAIDVGAGEKPYQPYFQPYVRRYLGLEYRRRSNTDVQGTAERLPFVDQCADVILCTQLLEHATDPLATIREWHRVLRRGGLAFASTHGTFVYHPDPVDYWRFTHAGLRKLFEDAGLNVRSINICGGTLAAVASVLAANAPLIAFRRGMRYPTKLALLLLHLGIDAVDPASRIRVPSDTEYGRTAINYLIVAKKDG